MTTQATAQTDDLQTKRARYLNLAVPVRLGELAESLLFAKYPPAAHPKYPEWLRRALNECINSIDWTMADLALNVQAELTELRAQLSAWSRDAATLAKSDYQRQAMIDALNEWSQKMLNRSGLANYENWQVEFDYPPGIRAAAAVMV